MTLRVVVLTLLLGGLTVPALAQNVTASPEQFAANPVVSVQINEQLRSPPDQASLNVSTEGRAPTATPALAQTATKTKSLLAAIEAAGIVRKDVQTQGISLRADYRYDQANGRSIRRFEGYVASNSVRIKTRNLDRITALLDGLTAAGATGINGPYFEIADPLPIRALARRRAMERGQAEAMEYARNAGFSGVQLMTVQEGASYRASDIMVTGTRIVSNALPPPPPPPAPERDETVAPGQIETGITLSLQYRMVR